MFSYVAYFSGRNDTSLDTPTWRQGLWLLTERECTPQDLNNDECYYNVTTGERGEWAPYPGQQYYGRGAFQMKWNYIYGQFS